MSRSALNRFALAAGVAAALASADVAASEQLTVVSSRDTFVSLIEGRELQRFGITLTVTTDGQIIGRAFGYDVTGAWEWENGYFCRDLFWGGDDLGFNCQQVAVSGDTLRFTSDRGTGRFADLNLR